MMKPTDKRYVALLFALGDAGKIATAQSTALLSRAEVVPDNVERCALAAMKQLLAVLHRARELQAELMLGEGEE